MARLGFLNRSLSRTQGEATRVFPQRRSNDTRDEVNLNTKLNKGINIALDPIDIDKEFLAYGLNGRIRDDNLQKRAGFNDSTPFAAKPNSNAILGLHTTKRFDASYRYLRYTASSVHIAASSASWTAVTGGALGGAATDRFQQIVVQNRIFFHNNGVLSLQEINVGANTYAQAGNSRRYKWYVPINNRIVGLNLVGPSANPIQVGGCGDLAYTSWDPATDITAFEVPLLDSQGGYGDFLYWGANLNDRLIVLRERSIWLGTPQPIASNPFRWQQLIPDFGTAATYSAQVIPGGIIWYDTRRESFYLYRLGDTLPIDIGIVLGGEIAKQLPGPDLCWSSFDPYTWEYRFGFTPTGSSTAKVYVYNVLASAWMLDEIANCNGIWNNMIPLNLSVIDSLTGTIDSLSGTIDSLSGNATKTANVLGTTTGDLFLESTSGKAATDNRDNGTAITSEWRSKLFEFPAEEFFVNKLEFEYSVSSGTGSFEILYSIDGGVTFTSLKTVTVSPLASNENIRRHHRASKNIKCRNFMWAVRSTTLIDFKLLEVSMNVQAGGIKQR